MKLLTKSLKGKAFQVNLEYILQLRGQKKKKKMMRFICFFFSFRQVLAQDADFQQQIFEEREKELGEVSKF